MRLSEHYKKEKENIVNNCILCGNCVTKCRVMEHVETRDSAQDIQRSIVDYIKGSGALSEDAQKKVNACMRCFGCMDVACPIGTNSMMINEIADVESHRNGAKIPYEEMINYPSHDKLSRKFTSEQEYDRIMSEKIEEGAEILFFPGCNVYKQPDKLLNALTVLDAIGEKYSFLPGMKNCCGWTDRGRDGDAEWLQNTAEQLFNKARSLSVKTMVFWCPTCLCVLETKIKKFLTPEFDCITYGEYVAANLDKLQFPNAVQRKITLHEPCKTAYLGIDRDDNSVRKILEAIPGTELVEMEHHGKDTLCCGCDAVDNAYETGEKAAVKRLKEAKESGAECMIDVCHNCHWIFKPIQNHHRDEFDGIDIVNYSTYIAEAMGKGRKDSLKQTHHG